MPFPDWTVSLLTFIFRVIPINKLLFKPKFRFSTDIDIRSLRRDSDVKLVHQIKVYNKGKVAKKVRAALSMSDSSGRELPPIYLKWYLFQETRDISRHEAALLDVVKCNGSQASFCMPDKLEDEIDKYDYNLEANKVYQFAIQFFEENHRLSDVTISGIPIDTKPFKVIK